jgi:hypothetical protein
MPVYAELSVLADLFDARRVSHHRLDTAVESAHGLTVWAWCDAVGCTRTRWREALLAALPVALAIPLGDAQRRHRRTGQAVVFRPAVEFLGRDGVQLRHVIAVRCQGTPAGHSTQHLRLELAVLKDEIERWPALDARVFFETERVVSGATPV